MTARKVTVFSDSHGRCDFLRHAMERDGYNSDCVIHLGDGEDDITEVMRDYRRIPLISVAGNREEYLTPYSMRDSLFTEIAAEIVGARMFLTHGHKYNVKYSTALAVNRAIAEECRILLYGHTHCSEISTVKGENGEPLLYIMNPGAAPFSYGIITLSGDGIGMELIKAGK